MRMRHLIGLCFALILLLPCWAQAEERILSFDSHIQVHDSGDLKIRETIRVRSEGVNIKRGIYRDFPTKYKTDTGNTIRVGFKVTGIKRDGSDEPYHIDNLSNGKRIYIGSRNVFLPQGEYTYEIDYETTGQLGYFGDHDELYWNVTGNGWDFPIDQASAEVILPSGIPSSDLKTRVFTGYQGSRASEAISEIDEYSPEVSFRTTQPLQPRQGLTIVVAWPKGFFREPNTSEKLGRLIGAQNGVWGGLLALVGLFGFYSWSWARVGKDPEAGVIIPLFEPPKGISPAAGRYIQRMGYDTKAFTAAVVSLASKGWLTINESGKKDYVLMKNTEPGKGILSNGEKALFAKLFETSDTLSLKRKNHAKVSATIKELKKALKAEYRKSYFTLNIRYMFIGTLLTVGAVILAGLPYAEDKAALIFIVLKSSIWFGITFWLWQTGNRKMALIMTLFLTAFFGVFFAGLVSIGYAVMVVALVLMNLWFFHLIKAPTRLGRKTMDQIEGFKSYLEVAEKDRLNILNPPEKTPELFEKYLPWALALGVDQQWSEQFAAILAAAGKDGGTYQPSWYHGSNMHNFNAARFSSSLASSLTSAISSASTAPGSSSGMGGGGFSGGGGGGGGGGGW